MINIAEAATQQEEFTGEAARVCPACASAAGAGGHSRGMEE